jgi:hypothetical protein
LKPAGFAHGNGFMHFAYVFWARSTQRLPAEQNPVQ